MDTYWFILLKILTWTSIVGVIAIIAIKLQLVRNRSFTLNAAVFPDEILTLISSIIDNNRTVYLHISKFYIWKMRREYQLGSFTTHITLPSQSVVCKKLLYKYNFEHLGGCNYCVSADTVNTGESQCSHTP